MPSELSEKLTTAHKNGTLENLRPYEVLGFDTSAALSQGSEAFINENLNQIKKTYRALALEFHPDKNPDNEMASAIFKKVNASNEILSDQEKLAEYNLRIKNNYKTTTPPETPTSSATPTSPYASTSDGASSEESSFSSSNNSSPRESFSSESNTSFYTDEQVPLIETIDDIRDLLEIVHEKLASPELESAYRNELLSVSLKGFKLTENDFEMLNSLGRKSYRGADLTNMPTDTLIKGIIEGAEIKNAILKREQITIIKISRELDGPTKASIEDGAVKRIKKFCENAIKTASCSLYSKPDNDDKALLNTLKKAANYTEMKQAFDEHPIKKGSYIANLLENSGFSSFVNFSATQQQENFFTKK